MAGISVDEIENELDLLDPIVDLTSPLSSVDARSRDRAVVQEELEKRLRSRAGIQDLVQRNILPPLATAPKLMNQTQQLQKAKNADSLQKKLRNRPDRTDLRQLNILPDLHMNIDPALQAKQVQLMKSKKVDSLNEKLANRPGPIQLIKDRILEPELAAVIEDVDLERLASEEESRHSQDIPSIALQRTASESRQRPLIQRHSIATSSPSSAQLSTGALSPTKDLSSPLSLEAQRRKMSDSSLSPINSPGDAYEDRSPPIVSPRGFTSTYPPATIPLNATHTQGIMSSGIGKAPSPSQARKKQQKQQGKPYRKLRYHEYVPPTKNTPKGGKQTPKTPPKSNNPYDLLLQQQQLYLQLQVLQQNGAVMQKLPDLLNSLSKDQKNLALAAMKVNIPVSSAGELPLTLSKQISITQQLPQVINVEKPNKQNISTVRFDDLKVNDLKAACKEMGMIVSGKKAELVERLLDANKRLLPARALPDNTPKDSRRQVLSLGATSSIDSQLSNPPTSSPNSPTSSPVFTFPSDQHNGSLHHSQSYTNIKHPNSQLRHGDSLPSMLPEVFPASTLRHEFDEMIIQQKRNYLSSKGQVGVKLAPCPDLDGLVAIKLPPSYPAQAPPSYQQSINQKTGHRAAETKLQLQVSGDKSSHSLPSSPIVANDGMCTESMEDAAHSNTTTSPLATCNASVVGGQGSNDSFMVSSCTPMNMTTSVVHGDSSLVNNNNLVGSVVSSRHRMSVPDVMHVKVHPMNPPSYEVSVQRSMSLSGLHPQLGQLPSASFGPDDLSSLAQDSMMMDMDTGENLTDLFDIIKGDSTAFPPSAQPQSLPATLPHHHTLNSHPHMNFTSPTKLIPRPEPVQSDNIMLGSMNSQKSLTGSDLCLSLPAQGDNSRNSIGNESYNMAGNIMLGNELGWLDLENVTGANFSGLTPGFGNIGSQSNPGSLPQDQFQMHFLDNNNGQLGANFMKTSNPALNGMIVPGNDISSFLDPHQSGLLQSDEKALLELGLSTS